MRTRLSVVLCGTAFVCSAIVMTPAPTVAQTREAARAAAPADRMPADIRAAYEFLFAAYPDLVGRALEIQIKPEGKELLLSLAEVPSVPPGTSPGAAPPPVLVRARVEFDAQGRLERYNADGPYLYDVNNATLKESMRKNPAWGESQAEAELTRLGGGAVRSRAFTPASAKAGEPAMARFLGPGVSEAAARFEWRDTNPGVAALVKPRWVVDAAAPAADGSNLTYRLEYEPIGGRLVGVTRQGGAQ